MTFRSTAFVCLFAPVLALATGAAAAPGAAQQALLGKYAAEAKAADPAFTGFSAERGKTFFLSQHVGGKPDTPSCSTCHTTDPRQPGRTRAGKEIGPMALSAKPDRYADPAETEKWFRRNCDSVLGRACTAAEKGDFISFMVGQ